MFLNMEIESKPSMKASPGSLQVKDKYIEPKQSANTLFHFIDEMKWLKKVLVKQKLFQRYCEEKFNFVYEKMPDIAFPMKCFCDIHLNKLSDHRTLYGGFGIAFSKEWGIEKGLQPVQYLNKNSSLDRKYHDALKAIMEEYGQSVNYLVKNHSLLLYDLFYIKPLNGKMQRKDGDKDCNFHD